MRLPLLNRFQTQSLPADNTEETTRREVILDAIRRMPPPDLLTSNPVSQMLFDRLGEADLEEIERNADVDEMEMLRGASPQDQVWLRLAIGVKHAIPAVLNSTGLSPQMPPDHIHAMSRSWLGCGGSYGHADEVVDALSSAGLELHKGLAGLDFGCSSARVVRVLAAAFPDVEWHGCDPNEEAISWAASQFGGIEFQGSPLRPPLGLASASIDFAYAISIWSHFNAEAGLEWFEEQHRIIKPGGLLVLTAHGWSSVAYYLKTQERSEEQLFDISRSLLSSGFWYAAEFGEAGDYGVIDSDWGTAFLTPGWLAARLCPAWHIVRFCPGRECGNQDLYVLRRSP